MEIEMQKVINSVASAESCGGREGRKDKKRLQTRGDPPVDISFVEKDLEANMWSMVL